MGHTSEQLREIYSLLDDYFGPLHWWPADSVLEVIIGAILTQNTNWSNVEKAIDTLKLADLLTFDALLDMPEEQLAGLIRSSGYHSLKARRVKNLLEMIAAEYDGDVSLLFAEHTSTAREALLRVKGIGPETADSILLYAGEHPVFVVDAYTHRILSRHSMVPESCDYETIQDLFMDNLEHDAALFNQYHALLVMTAKRFCKKREPLCSDCPLGPLL